MYRVEVGFAKIEMQFFNECKFKVKQNLLSLKKVDFEKKVTKEFNSISAKGTSKNAPFFSYHKLYQKEINLQMVHLTLSKRRKQKDTFSVLH